MAEEQGSMSLKGLKTYATRAGAVLSRGIRDTRFHVESYVRSLSQDPRTRFLTVAWCVTLLFLSLVLLAGLNPLRLLIPGLTYDWPSTDVRTPTRLYAVSRSERKLVPIERVLLLEGPLPARIRHVALVVSDQPGLRERSETDYQDLEQLPDLGLAIKKVWELGDSGRIIVDLRGSTIESTVGAFVSAQGEALERSRASMLDAYFAALTASVFSAISEVQSIEYRIDGEAKTLNAMDFNLRKRYVR